MGVSIADKICARASTEPMHELKKNGDLNGCIQDFWLKSKTYYKYVLIIFRFYHFHLTSYISDLLIKFYALKFIVW